MSWRDDKPGELLGRKRYLEVLDEAIARARNPRINSAFKLRGETLSEFRERIGAKVIDIKRGRT